MYKVFKELLWILGRKLQCYQDSKSHFELEKEKEKTSKRLGLAFDLNYFWRKKQKKKKKMGSYPEVID